MSVTSAVAQLDSAIADAADDPVALGMILAKLLSREAIVRGMLGESVSSSSSSAETGGAHATHKTLPR